MLPICWREALVGRGHLLRPLGQAALQRCSKSPALPACFCLSSPGSATRSGATRTYVSKAQQELRRRNPVRTGLASSFPHVHVHSFLLTVLCVCVSYVRAYSPQRRIRLRLRHRARRVPPSASAWSTSLPSLRSSYEASSLPTLLNKRATSSSEHNTNDLTCDQVVPAVVWYRHGDEIRAQLSSHKNAPAASSSAAGFDAASDQQDQHQQAQEQGS